MQEEHTIREAGVGDIQTIRTLANAVWPVAYANILSGAQLRYMLEMFYSAESLQDQMAGGNHFLILEKDDQASGFAAYCKMGSDAKWKLHKLYLLPATQGSGLGKMLLRHVEDKVLQAGGKQLLLNVNRENPALYFYRAAGYTVVSEEDIDIGEGYFMNDFVMGKTLSD